MKAIEMSLVDGGKEQSGAVDGGGEPASTASPPTSPTPVGHFNYHSGFAPHLLPCTFLCWRRKREELTNHFQISARQQQREQPLKITPLLVIIQYPGFTATVKHNHVPLSLSQGSSHHETIPVFCLLSCECNLNRLPVLRYWPANLIGGRDPTINKIHKRGNPDF